jgi:putative protein-disulfide isomerase
VKSILPKKKADLEDIDNIEMTFYTDPLCCWSWAMRPILEKLKLALGPSLTIRYCMSGLIPSWKFFFDPVNSVKRPAQMGPVWMHASAISGTPIQANLWVTDPPASSFPSCIAFKCAELQSAEYAVLYLNLLQKAAMVNGINIAKPAEMIKVADELKSDHPNFDLQMFAEDLFGIRGREAFKSDMNEVRAMHIERFPSIIFRSKGKRSLLVSGYRNYEGLIQAVEKLKLGIKTIKQN